MSATEAARGHWFEILTKLGGISPDHLQDKHGPCPACGGKDRFRWDDLEGSGSGYCNQCGSKDGSGGALSGMDLLTRVTGWDFKQACRRIEQHLGTVQTVHRSITGNPVSRSGTVQTVQSPRPEPPTAGAEQFWRYNEDFLVCRFPDPVKGKKIRPLLWNGSAWVWKHHAKPRPLYWARRSAAAPVLIAEGEKAADAAAKLFPDHAVCTWPGGTSNVQHADWHPLLGRSVTIWPDADDVGRKAAAQLARILLGLRCTVQVVNPSEKLPQGWDLADGLAEGMTPTQAAGIVARFTKAIELPPDVPDAEPSPPAAVPAPEIPSSAPFVCLGFSEGVYYYQPGSTGQVISLSRSSHTGTNLLTLAPLAYWETLFPSKTGANWLAAASSLFETQAAAGIFSADRIRGRGAWWDDGRSVLHLGDRLLIDGTEQSISKAAGSKFHYQRLASIDIPKRLELLPDELGMEIIDIASRFHWEVPASGLLLAGWIALAPICGAMQWRPHVWLTASAGSGKSAILDRFIGILLESMALFPEGNTTEAFIRQQLRADAIPVIFDEAESNEKADRQRIQNILSLARVSSSSGRGVIGKGGADGTAQSFTIRSMFLLCSISTALKQGADQSRFAQLTLRNPSFLPKPERTAHWSALDADITRLCTAEMGHRLLLRMVRQIPIIRDSVAVFRRAAAERFDSQRQGDQYGTLLAGAWSLANSRPATIEDAYQLIDANSWDAYREQTEADEERCLQHILQHQVRVESEERICTRTLGELVEITSRHRLDNDVTTRQAHDALSRHGLKVNEEQKRLLISHTAKAIASILRETAWGNGWSTVLSRLPGAERVAAVRFSGAGAVSRAISIPIADL